MKTEEINNQNTYFVALTASKNKTILFLIHVLMGSILLALSAQLSVKLPFTPIPVSLQTLSLFLLIIAQGKNKATASVVCYLAQATCGLPVLAAANINPLWIIGPTGGYLLGFLACTLISGYLLERKSSPSLPWVMFSLLCGQVAIYTLGTSMMAVHIGWEQAFALGVVPFVSGAVIKLLVATCVFKPITWINNILGR